MSDRLEEISEKLDDKDYGWYAQNDIQWIVGEVNRLREELAAANEQIAIMKRNCWRKPTHGTCCTCQRCGKNHDDCKCDLDEVCDELNAANEAIRANVSLLASALPLDQSRAPEQLARLVVDEVERLTRRCEEARPLIERLQWELSEKQEWLEGKP